MKVGDDWWRVALEDAERRLRHLRAVRRGDEAVYKVFRRGYRERKLRVVKDHYIHIVRPLGWVAPKRGR